MTIKVDELVSSLAPETTVLLFGSGSSLPSGAPTTSDLQQHFENKFSVPAIGFTLSEQASIIENNTKDRKLLIKELQSKIKRVSPTGSILNLPLYKWKSIYTTNYDQIIEKCYERKNVPAVTISSNYDFGERPDPRAIQIFKLHGTINNDVAFGHNARIVLTERDYDLVKEYREHLFDRFKADIAGANLVVIGHSLSDPDIKTILERAVNINSASGGTTKITVFSYDHDEHRGALLESRGVRVCFGSLDDFFGALARSIDHTIPPQESIDSLLDSFPALRTTTRDVADERERQQSDVSAMFNGWPASYADIDDNLTFHRTVTDQIESQFRTRDKPFAVLLGPSGVGKTTAARQTLVAMLRSGSSAWEHKEDQPFRSKDWRKLAEKLKEDKTTGVLFIDDAHSYLSDINNLLDGLNADENNCLKIIIVSSTNQWYPRVKSPVLFGLSEEYSLVKINNVEIDRLLELTATEESVRRLVEKDFAGFSRPEMRRRLTQRCEADMFVCLKNIFSSDKLDDIILREYATLESPLQDVYKLVAAMESAGVRVHRQLIIRFLGIRADRTSTVLDGLSDIIHEQTVNEREGIFTWKGRHVVIMHIIAEHKYYSENSKYKLLDKIIDYIHPTYDIELRSLRELCSVDTGISAISDRNQQNVLLRKMISVAPRERVPRHRLIRNLISLGKYDQADTEIRLFERDFRIDAPTARYRIDLAVGRATQSPGLMHEDRIVLLEKARDVAASATSRFRHNKAVLTAYCQVGLELARLAGDWSVFDAAIRDFKEAEQLMADPDMSKRISRIERRMDRIVAEEGIDFTMAEVDQD